MNPIDYILIIAVAVILILAIKNSRKSKCLGCTGDCHNCPGKIYLEKIPEKNERQD
ncbi:MAG TPA: hypothetical protein PLI19_01655 [Erysipelotrichaceae bacterium]|nr:hypothetical protein [Erysipelotrichaceae bacterium]HQB32013.1 hypothetical protein [Erysipelotrichaceae bacterium]